MSIATELALLANTKEGLRVSLGLSKDVPFSQYENYIYDIPSAGEFYDFVKNRFFSDGETRSFSDMPSQFTRLSSATMWKADKLVDVTENTPRIGSDGLLIEPQRTNTAIDPGDTFPGGVGFDVEHLGYEGAMNLYKLTELEIVSGKRAGILFTTPTDTFSANSFYFRSEGAEYIGTGYNYFDGSKLAVYSATTGKILQTTTTGQSTIEKDAIDVGGGFIVNFNKDPGGVAVAPRSIFGASNYSGDLLRQNNSYMGDSSNVLVIGAFQCEPDAVKSSSYIPTAGSPATRAKETLVIPFADGQTVTADKDESVTMTIVDNNAVFEGQGYIRSIRVN